MIAAAAGRTKATGIQGKGSAAHQKRDECIWIKPNAILQPSLFDALEVTE